MWEGVLIGAGGVVGLAVLVFSIAIFGSITSDNRKTTRYAEQNGWERTPEGFAKEWTGSARVVAASIVDGKIVCSIRPFRGEDIPVEGFANVIYAMSFADSFMERFVNTQQDQPITRDLVLAHRAAYTPTLH